MTHDELLDLVDENDMVIGTKLRSEVYAEHLSNFRVINTFIKNAKGELWIPRRTANKKIFPSCLDVSAGGHVESGESYEITLQREVAEELNININSVSVRLLGHLTPRDHNVSAFMNVYEIILDKAPQYNPDDFVGYEWLLPHTILDRIAAGDGAKSDLPKLIKLFYAQ